MYKVTPDAVSLADHDRTVVFHGKNLLAVDGVPSKSVLLPETFGQLDLEFEASGRCKSTNVTNQRHASVVGLCESYNVAIPQRLHPLVETSQVTVHNRHAELECKANAPMMLFPPPALLDVFPPAICQGRNHTVTISGANMLQIDGVPPSFELEWNDGAAVFLPAPENVMMANCSTHHVSPHQGLNISVCSTAVLQLQSVTEAVGVYTIHISNPPPTLGTDNTTSSGKIQIVPSPSLSEIDAPLLCAHQTEKTVTATGVGLVSLTRVVGGVTSLESSPTHICIDGATCEFVSATGCTSRDTINEASTFRITICSAYTVRMRQDFGVPSITFPYTTVLQPGSTGGAWSSTELLALHPEPTTDRIVYPIVCKDASQTIQIEGANYALVGSAGPTVVVNGAVVSPSSVTLSNCTTVTNVPRTTLQNCGVISVQLSSKSHNLSTINDVVVNNPTEAANCTATKVVQFRVVSRPSVTRVGTPILCRSQVPTSLRIDGLNFLALNGIKPRVVVGGMPVHVREMAACTTYLIVGHALQLCQQMLVTIAQSSEATRTTPSIRVDTPQSTHAAKCNECISANASGLLQFTVAPTIDAYFPAVCGLTDAQNFSVTGTNLLFLQNGTVPSIRIGGVPRDVVSRFSCVSIASYVSGAVGQNKCPDNGAEITSESECKTAADSRDLAYTVLESNAASPRGCIEIVSSGQSFGVRFNTHAVGAAGANTRTICYVEGTGAEVCSHVVVRLTQVKSNFVTEAIRISNNDGCSVASSQVVSKDTRAPIVNSWAPSSLCSGSSGQTLAVNGYFPRVAGKDSLVHLSGKLAKQKAAQGCASHNPPACDGLVVDVPNGLSLGNLNIDVKAACEASTTSFVAVVPTPLVMESDTAVICETQSKQVTLSGEQIIPAATVRLVGSGLSTATPATSVQNCVTEGDVSLCTHATFAVTPFSLAPGTVHATATNGNDACEGNLQNAFQVIKEPVITSVNPAEYCYDQGHALTIVGQHFRAGHTRAWLVADVDDTAVFEATSLASVTTTGFVAFFEAEFVPVGTYTIRILNGPSCVTTESSVTLRVHPKLFAMFADPLIAYNGIRTDVAIFTSGLISQALEIVFEHGNGNTLIFGKTNSTYVTRDGTHLYNRIQVTLPSQLAPGEWHLNISSDIGCTTSLKAAITVTDQNVIDIVDVDPSFVWEQSGGAISITSSQTPASGKFKFESLPRIYITPTSDSSLSGVALTSTAILSDVLITAVVSPSAGVGTYVPNMCKRACLAVITRAPTDIGSTLRGSHLSVWFGLHVVCF